MLSAAGPSNADSNVGIDAVTTASNAGNNDNAVLNPTHTAPINTNSSTDLGFVCEFLVEVVIATETVVDAS